MFKSERVGCYLNGFAGHGDDPDAKELKLVFHIGAISRDLANEVSPLLADRLFRQNPEGEWVQAEEITKASFAGIQVPMQNITFHAHEDPNLLAGADAVLIPGCSISNLRATRPAVQARLEFDVVVPMDALTMRLVEKYYRAECFLTMQPVQRPMEYKEDAAQQQSLQDAADSDTSETPTEEPPKQRKKRERKARTTEQATEEALVN